MPRFDADWIDSMLRPERRGAPPAAEMLGSLGLRPADVVVDVGCGPGFYTLPAARLVAPGGRVYAVDLEPRMLDLVRERAAAAGVLNVEIVRSTGPAIPLDDAVADLVIAALLLHDLADRAPMARELRRVARPGGRVVVAEWQPEPNDPRPNRLTPVQTAALLEGAGLRVVASRPLGSKQYLVLAQSPGSG
jgi:ubiquinone/menaquinone biosynthesis C-methylase UbiE